MTPGCLHLFFLAVSYFVIQPFKRLFPGGLLQFALPHHDDIPAHLPQFLLLPCVAFNVSFEFMIPEFPVGCRSACIPATLMPVPEAAVDEYNGLVLWQHDIRMSRISPVVFSESQSFRKEIFSDDFLRLGVLAADAGHVVVSLLFV